MEAGNPPLPSELGGLVASKKWFKTKHSALVLNLSRNVIYDHVCEKTMLPIVVPDPELQ